MFVEAQCETSRPGVNRRDLLRLRRLGAEMSAPRAFASPGAIGPQVHRPDPGHRPAMGSYFEVRLGAGSRARSTWPAAALDLIDELEAQLTVYRDDSEVSRLNATAHLGPVEVEPGLFGLLEQAVALGQATAGPTT